MATKDDFRKSSKKRIVLLVVFYAILASSLHAQTRPPTVTANELAVECAIAVDGKAHTGPQNLQIGHCYGYIGGFADAHSAASTLFCAPPEVTVGQIVKVFLKYMNEHPEDLHRHAGEMLGLSLKKAFACPEGK